MSSTIQSAIQKRRRRGPHESQPSSRDASEEDNDESPLPPPTGTGARPHHPIPHSPMRPKKVDIPPFNVSDDAGSDDAGADGDIDSSSTSVANQHLDPLVPKSPPTPSSSSFTSNLPDPIQRGTTPTPPEPAKSTTPSPPSPPPAPRPVIVQLPQEDIRAFVQRAIKGEEEPSVGVRSFKVNEPPSDRPVRIYADGVYDLFHYGHALQMRQAKLCFPSVHLIIGVCSDDLCKSHKALPALTHAERCESVKHCRWVDEVAPDAPWELTQEFIDEHRIDYVAHDEEPYAVAGKADLYEFLKKQGKFLPTRRTPGISTSDLLERIVSEYREGVFDGKLSKNGHPELRADLVDWSSRVSSASSS